MEAACKPLLNLGKASSIRDIHEGELLIIHEAGLPTAPHRLEQGIWFTT
jgi:hypothetical protein